MKITVCEIKWSPLQKAQINPLGDEVIDAFCLTENASVCLEPNKFKWPWWCTNIMHMMLWDWACNFHNNVWGNECSVPIRAASINPEFSKLLEEIWSWNELSQMDWVNHTVRAVQFLPVPLSVTASFTTWAKQSSATISVNVSARIPLSWLEPFCKMPGSGLWIGNCWVCPYCFRIPLLPHGPGSLFPKCWGSARMLFL